MDFKRFLTYLPPDPTKKVSGPDVWIFSLAFYLVLTGVVIVYLSFLSDTRYEARVLLKPQDWHVMTGGNDVDCSTDSPVSKVCPASRDNQQLWKSKLTRDSREFTKWLSENPGKEFWLAITIKAAALRQAARDGGETLLLGQINGRARVWVDGSYYQQAIFAYHDLPMQINLPRPRLWADEDLHVAIRVNPNPNYSTMDRAQATPAGLYAANDTDRAVRWSMFIGMSRHLVALALFLIYARIMRAALSANGSSYDYIVGGQFALLLAVMSMLSLDFATRVLSMPFYFRLCFAATFLEGIFIVRLALAYLRSRRSLSLKSSLSMTLATLACLFLIPSGWIEATGLHFLEQFYLPAVYLYAATIIGLRARELVKDGSQSSGARLDFLVVSAIVLGVTGLSYTIESWNAVGQIAPWSRYWNLVTIFVLARWLAKDFKLAIRLVESTPVSRYHKLSRLPQKVEGWILMLDLRKSESWFRAGAEYDNGGAIINTVLSHVWSAVNGAGGQVLQSEGDSLIVLFETQGGRESQRLSSAISNVDITLKDLSVRLKDAIPEGSFLPTLTFRAAAVRGAVRPIWKDAGSTKIPAWIEASSSNPFVDAARLMELERELEGGVDESLIVMKADEARHFAYQTPVPDSGWQSRDITRTDKKQTAWQISVLIGASLTETAENRLVS